MGGRTVLVAGASGLIGRELTRQLAQHGHEVLRLVRARPRSADEINWAPSANTMDTRVMERVDAVVNLAGASFSRMPWTRHYRRQLMDSRIQATKTLAEAMNTVAHPPSVFVNASATGFYGDRPGERLTEESARGEGFLPELVDGWERTARIAPERTRVVTVRTGMVIARGGALAPLLRLTALGLATRFGTGGQHWPWVSLHDEAAAIRHLLDSDLTGAVNLVGPVHATSDRITSLLARRLHRWYNVVVPEWSVEAVLGAAGREVLLASQRVVPERLTADGFQFEHRTVEEAVDAALAR